MNVFRHTGDLGDVLAFLPVMRAMGGGQLILGNVNGIGAREPMTLERYSAIAPLIEIQPYVNALSFEHDARGVTHCCHHFRQTPMREGEKHTLVNWIADYFGVKDVDLSPWLTGIEPSEESKGKTIFARTLRYRNPQWRWQAVVDNHLNAMFIGFEDEWRDLCLVTGRQVPWRKTENLLEVAQLIKGSEQLISNQSCHWWIAFAMNVPTTQETDRNNINSIIRRDNARYEMGAFP